VTTSTTLATNLWQRLINGVVPPFGALEMLMEAEGCDRPKALVMLHEAAAEWAAKGHPTGHDQWKLSVICCYVATQNLAGASAKIASVRADKDIESPWFPWCDRVDQAIAILRALAEIP
jgi:hypothetical protein